MDSLENRMLDISFPLYFLNGSVTVPVLKAKWMDSKYQIPWQRPHSVNHINHHQSDWWRCQGQEVVASGTDPFPASSTKT